MSDWWINRFFEDKLFQKFNCRLCSILLVYSWRLSSIHGQMANLRKLNSETAYCFVKFQFVAIRIPLYLFHCILPFVENTVRNYRMRNKKSKYRTFIQCIWISLVWLKKNGTEQQQSLYRRNRYASACPKNDCAAHFIVMVILNKEHKWRNKKRCVIIRIPMHPTRIPLLNTIHLHACTRR